MKRLPEAVPVANADQSDTPGLGRLVQSRLHLLTHRTAELYYRAGTPLTWLPRPSGRGKVFDGGFLPRVVVDVPREKGPDPKPIKMITH